MLSQPGPILIAANHPNSFLDAIILSSLFKRPIYSLARGDAFTNKLVSKILGSLNMLPVYRVSEGVENLEHNYTTFDACQKLFDDNKIVLIFSEGRCINEWHLRSLKKGTARLALTAWLHNVPLQVLPLGINYSSFRKFGKTLILNFGNFITEANMYEDLATGKAINEFNDQLLAQLKGLVYEIEKKDIEKRRHIFYTRQSVVKRILLFIPAITGFVIHAPLYYAIHFIIKNRAKDHYDSIMVGLLFIFYPLYVLLLTFTLFLATGNSFFLLLLLGIPATALCLLHFKEVIH